MKILIHFLMMVGFWASPSWSEQAPVKEGGVWFVLDNKSDVPISDPKGGFQSQNSKLNEIVKKFKISKVSDPLSNSRNPELKKVIEMRCSGCDLSALRKQLTEAGFGNAKRPVELAPVYQLLATPNDYSLAVPNDYALNLIGAQCAWDVTIGNPNVVIAISDLNFYANPNDGGVHEELAKKPIYYDATNITSRNHGTAVAILAAGNTHNHIGKSSIGFNSGLALYFLGYNEMLAAANAGHRVINISWTSGCDFSTYAQQAVNEAYDKGAFLVAAAGNGIYTCNGPGTLVYPAAYDHVFAVTSIGPNNNHEKYPGFPITAHQHNAQVDLSAPGYDVAISPKPGYYFTGDGTSYASPLVAGTVGLMAAVNPGLTNAEIEQILKSTSLFIDNVNPNYAGLIGAGRLNACAAVAAAKGKSELKATVMFETFCSQEYIYADLVVTGGVKPYSYSWSNGATTEDLKNASPGIYSVTVTDAVGKKTTVSVTIPGLLNMSGVVTPSTNHLNTGAINLTVTGQAPQTFSWKSASGFTASTEDISGLAPDKYSVTVTSVKGCKMTKSFTVLNRIRVVPRENGMPVESAQ